MEVPLIYSAIAQTDVKVFKISVSDFQTKVPHEIHSIMEQKSFEKLKWIKTRLE